MLARQIAQSRPAASTAALCWSQTRPSQIGRTFGAPVIATAIQDLASRHGTQ